MYRPYLSAYGGMFGLSPLEDQALAGALMWLTVTLAYLIPALVFANHIRVEIAFPCQDFVGRESHVTSVRVRRVERSPR